MLRHKSIGWYPMMFGLLSLLWGIWIVVPGGAQIPENLLPNNLVGGTAIVVGGLQMLSVALSRPRIVGFASAATFYLWLYLSLLTIWADWRATTLVFYVWNTIMTAFGYVNFKLNQEESGRVD